MGQKWEKRVRAGGRGEVSCTLTNVWVKFIHVFGKIVKWIFRDFQPEPVNFPSRW